MSNINKQALRYGDNVLWFLNELAAYDASDIDGGEFDVYGEDRNGSEGCSTIDVTELAADAAKLIEAAEKRIAELEAREVLPDEMTPKQASRSYCGEVRGYRDGWNACRAAMLQAGNHTEQHLDMVGHPGDANENVDCRLPFDQWLSKQNEPIDVDCGCVTTEAFYHWLRVAYEAGNPPVTPDGYVLVPKELTCEMDDAAWGAYHETRCMSDIWAALLAAAPQQELK